MAAAAEPRHARAASGRWSASPTAACRPSPSPPLVQEGRVGEIRHVRAQYLQDWLVDPESPLTWRLQKDRAGSGALGRHRRPHHRPRPVRHRRADHGASRSPRPSSRERPLPGRRARAVSGGRGTGRRWAGHRRRRGHLPRAAQRRRARHLRGHPVRHRAQERDPAGDQRIPRHHRLRLRGHERPARATTRRPRPRSGFTRVLVTEATHPYVGGWWPAGHGLGYEHGFTHQAADLIAAIARGHRPRPSFADGLHVQEILAAVEASAANGSCWTPIDGPRAGYAALSGTAPHGPRRPHRITTVVDHHETTEGEPGLVDPLSLRRSSHDNDNDVNVLEAGHQARPQPPPVPRGDHGHGGRRRGHRRRRPRRPGRQRRPRSPRRKRGIILYTVRDAVGRDPLTSPLASGFKEVLAELSRSATGRSSSPASTRTPTPRGAPQHRRRVRRCCARGSTTTGSRPRATTAASPAPSPTPPSPRSTPPARSPTSSVWATSAPATTPRAARTSPTGSSPPSGGTSSGSARPRHGLKLYTHNHDIAYSFLLDSGPLDALGPPDPLVRRPSSRVLPGQHRPDVRLPRDGHLLGARRAVQAHPTPRPTAPCQVDLRPRRRGRGPDHALPALPRQGRQDRTRHRPTATSWRRSARATSTTRRSSRGGCQGCHNPMWEQDTAPGGPPTGPVAGVGAVSYDNMAALRG